MPDNEICRAILDAIGHPLLSSSLPGDAVEDYTHPEMMYERFGNKVDFVVDGGIGGIQPSTIVDCTSNDWTIIRQGKGEWVG